MLQLLMLLMQECLFFLGYVTGKSEFPPALTRAQEEACVRRMEAGDDTARQELITHNLRLVSHIARKYQVPGYGQDDLISIGVIGLIKAVNSFRSTAGTSLGTYAARCIENAILTPARHTWIFRARWRGFFTYLHRQTTLIMLQYRLVYCLILPISPFGPRGREGWPYNRHSIYKGAVLP